MDESHDARPFPPLETQYPAHLLGGIPGAAIASRATRAAPSDLRSGHRPLHGTRLSAMPHQLAAGSPLDTSGSRMAVSQSGSVRSLSATVWAGRRGILTGYLTQAASTPPITVVLLEDLLWGDLQPADRTELLERFLASPPPPKGPVLPRVPCSATRRPTPSRLPDSAASKRVLHTYLTFWNGLQPRPVPALYIDVF